MPIWGVRSFPQREWSQMCSGRGRRAPHQGIGVSGGSSSARSPRGRQEQAGGDGRWLSPAHAVPAPAAAPRWEPQPLSFQELQSERSEVPVSRLLEETALGRPGKEDSGTGTPGRPHAPLVAGGWR